MKVKIREMCKMRGTSLYKLAKDMHMPQQTVYSWASARTQPNYANMDMLCHFLECTPNDLFETEEPVNIIAVHKQVKTFKICSDCNGTGEEFSKNGHRFIVSTCSACNGEGRRGVA